MAGCLQHRLANVGIKALQIYVPSKAVRQEALEIYDGVSSGKYTVGHGQQCMSFCDDREDVYSIMLTVVSSLLRTYHVDVQSIGRLEVGTETLLDKSKSVKSVLMQLFEPYGNSNIEGADTYNACYGGTNAIFNAVNWIESSGWDGRDAIVACGDIAIYDEGSARATGGAGAVAFLIGPGAPIVFESRRKSSYMRHTYDFYKPDLTSEYPVAFGEYSVECYKRALDACYTGYKHTEAAIQDERTFFNGTPNQGSHTDDYKASKKPTDDSLEQFNYLCFHAPTCKIVAKAYGRLLYNDLLVTESVDHSLEEESISFRDLSYEDSLRSKELDRFYSRISTPGFTARTLPTLLVAAECGNMYTASLYSCLASLIHTSADPDLLDSKIGMFSFGSGLASTFFSLRVVGSTQEMQKGILLKEKLQGRNFCSPDDFHKALELRKAAHLQKNFTPRGSLQSLAVGTYYLTRVDEHFRRSYAIKQ